MQRNLKEIKEILRDYKLKATNARIGILQNFLKSSKNCAPMNAEEIYKKIKKGGVDLVTVYRTLASFEQAGLVRRVSMHKDSAFFELNTEHHHHVICTNCEKVSEFKNADDEKLVMRVLRQVKDFKKISYHSFDLFGICNSCLEK